jgi:pimeloyl-ACP methyl ester carboxylesterase
MSLVEHEGVRGRSWRKAPLVILVTILGLWVLAIGIVVSQEAGMIFLPPRVSGGKSPADSGIPFEDVHIPADANTYIDAWWIPAKEPNEKVLLYFHGNAEVLQGESGEVALFRQTGYNLVFAEYRGYGRSSQLQTTGITTAADARAAFKYLEQQRHIPASDIVLCGRSIGTGVAAQLAFETPGAGGLILVSPITSVADVANEEWIFRYPLRPTQWLRHDNDMATKDKIGSIHMPTLIMTGTEDSLAPPWMAKELYALSPGPKTIQLIKGTDHNYIMDDYSGMLLRTIETFLQSLPVPATSH